MFKKAIFVCVAVAVISTLILQPRRERSTSVSAPKPPTLKRGDECVVDNGGQVLWLARDEASRSKLNKYNKARDRAGVLDLIKSGHVLEVLPGTESLCLDPGVLTAELRILGGRHAGSTVLVPVDWVRVTRGRE